MKKITYILVIITTGILFNSCEEDFLDKPDPNEITNANFWASAADLQLYVNRLYGTFPGWAGSGSAPSKDIGTDIIIESNLWFGGVSTNRLDGTITAPTAGGGWSFGNIRNVNFFFDNVGLIEPSALSDHYIGEAHFFRAWHYFSLLKIFGDLPIITKVLDIENPDDEAVLYGSRSSRTEVANFILEELDNAISLMKEGSEVGPSRLNKDIAALFKARVALYEGTWEKYHNGTDFQGDTDGSGFLAVAAAAAKSVIDRGNYSIVSSGEDAYYNLFIQTDYSNGKEIMFSKQYNYLDFNIQNSLWNQPTTSGMTRAMTKYYLASNGEPISNTTLAIDDTTLEKIAENRDPRLAQSLMTPGDLDIITQDGVSSYFSVPDMSRNPTGYSIRKWRSTQLYDDFIAGFKGRTPNIRYILFRYAEVLLTYAEAKAELGTLTQDDVEMSINKLRDRAGMPHLNIGAITPDPNWPDYGYVIPDYVQEVRRERVVELFGEGNRLDDLMRWRAHKLFVGTRPLGTKYTSVIETKYPNLPVNDDDFLDPFVTKLATGSYGFDPNRDYLLAIPSNELVINPNLLPQNPGWED